MNFMITRLIKCLNDVRVDPRVRIFRLKYRFSKYFLSKYVSCNTLIRRPIDNPRKHIFLACVLSEIFTIEHLAFSLTSTRGYIVSALYESQDHVMDRIRYFSAP